MTTEYERKTFRLALEVLLGCDKALFQWASEEEKKALGERLTPVQYGTAGEPFFSEPEMEGPLYSINAATVRSFREDNQFKRLVRDAYEIFREGRGLSSASLVRLLDEAALQGLRLPLHLTKRNACASWVEEYKEARRRVQEYVRTRTVPSDKEEFTDRGDAP